MNSDDRNTAMMACATFSIRMFMYGMVDGTARYTHGDPPVSVSCAMS